MSSIEIIDFDGDGIDDCHNRSFKRNFSALLRDRRTATQVAVASVHLVLPDLLKDAETHETKKSDWSKEIADHLRSTYPGAAIRAIAGDFNIKRCEGPNPPEEKELQVCPERKWWKTLTSGQRDATGSDPYRYVDSIYARHGDPLRGGTQDRLTEQYRDGDTFRDRRIDFIFWMDARRGIQETPPWSSHDRTCGFLQSRPVGERNCRYFENPQRYSDHRLLWTLVPLDPPESASS